MKNSMFIPNSLQLKMLEKEKNKHQKKLNEIQSQDRKVKIVNRDITTSLKLSQTRQHNLKLAQKGKADGLEQENELLLGKLVEISRKKSPNFAIRSESANGKSLHAPYKKRENARISSENEAFAKRLISQQSTFDRRKLDVDFKKHKELVSQMKRINSSPLKGAGKKILPPIKSELTSPKSVSLIKSSVVHAKENKEKETKETKETKREQPQQENAIAASTVTNENQSVVVPAATDRKDEVAPKQSENNEANANKENNVVPGAEASNLQQSQELGNNVVQENLSQRNENTQVKEENTNKEVVQQETK